MSEPVISRRSFLAGAGSVLLAGLAAAQPAKMWRIGYLAPGMPDDAPLLQAFQEGLLALGYVEGQNMVMERRTAEGRLETLGALAEELVRLKVDIIVAPTTPAARAAKAATKSIPIVFTIVSDPVGSGLVASFAHPAGNATGLTDMGVDLTEKQLDFLKQIVPHLKRVAALGHPEDKVWDGVWKQAPPAAHRLGINVTPVLVSTADQLEAAFVDLNRRVQALLVAPQVFFSLHRQRLIALTASAKLPAIYERRAFPHAGALMSYGPNYDALLRDAAHHVDRILKGARPADLPVEQPTQYDLVINLKTAKSLGLTVPESVLARADELIR